MVDINCRAQKDWLVAWTILGLTARAVRQAHKDRLELRVV
jgi:hypothetical protein